MAVSPDQMAHLTDELERARQQTLELIAILQQEYRSLRDNDPSGLTETLKAKQQQLTKLDKISQARQMAWRDAGLASDQPPSHGTRATELWRDLRTLTLKCHDQNRLNGALLEQRHQHSQRVLAILSGQTIEDSTYGASGRAQYELSANSRAIA